MHAFIKNVIFFICIAFVLSACAPVSTPQGGTDQNKEQTPIVLLSHTATVPSTEALKPNKESEHRCGDGICDGPENKDRCPEDCGTVESMSTPKTEEASLPPVYVTVAVHIEDVPIYTNCDVYPTYRQKLLLFADKIVRTGAAINLQIEYEFFLGASQCETEAMKANTNGQNVIAYLASHHGFEIDPHQEGGWEEGEDNYADIRFLGEKVTPSISENVGGLVWDDPDQFARLSQGETGRIYPDFIWHPHN